MAEPGPSGASRAAGDTIAAAALIERLVRLRRHPMIAASGMQSALVEVEAYLYATDRRLAAVEGELRATRAVLAVLAESVLRKHYGVAVLPGAAIETLTRMSGRGEAAHPAGCLCEACYQDIPR